LNYSTRDGREGQNVLTFSVFFRDRLVWTSVPPSWLLDNLLRRSQLDDVNSACIVELMHPRLLARGSQNISKGGREI
jgi:hypothetical protein